MNDLEIAKSIPPYSIQLITQKLGLPEDKVEPYGRFKAKLDLSLIQEEKNTECKADFSDSYNTNTRRRGQNYRHDWAE